MSDWDRTANNASQFLSPSSSQGPVSHTAGPVSLAESWQLGRHVAADVEHERLSWSEAVIDSHLLLAERRRAATRRREPPVQEFGRTDSPNEPLLVRLVAPVVIAVDVVLVIATVVRWPSSLAVLALLAGALVGLALAARLEP